MATAPRATAPPVAEMPPPGSTPRTPPPPVGTPSASAGRYVSQVQQYIVLRDWWLERVEGEEGKIRVAGTGIDRTRKGPSSSKENMKRPARVVRSATIVKRNDFRDIETEDGFLIRLGATLDKGRMRENGFDDEVSECFEFGFPIQWKELTNPGHAQSPSKSTANASGHSVEYYMKLFMSEEFLSNPMNYAFFNPPSSCDLHESIRIDTSEQEMVDQSIRSVPLGHITCSVCPNSKVDGNIPASSKVVSVEKEGSRSRFGCGQAEKDADVQHMNMDNCSTEQETVTPSINGTQSRDVGTSEDNSVRRLRSGKVFGIPSTDSMKTGHKHKRVRHEASNKKNVPNEGATPTADLTQNENGSSAAGTVAEDNHQSNDPQRKGPGKPAKRRDSRKSAKKRRENKQMYWNFR